MMIVKEKIISRGIKMNKLLIAFICLSASAGVYANPVYSTPSQRQCHNCVQPHTANSVKLKFSSVDSVIYSKVKIKNSPFSGKNVAIGSYNLNIQGQGVFSGFCVDPYQSANSSFTNYEKSALDASDFNNNGVTRFANVQKLFDNAYGTLTSAVQTAGFHLALWEIFHDNNEESTGNIKGISGSNATMLSYADSFLDQLNGWTVKNTYSIDFFESVCNQDFIIAKLNPPTEVPLPAALPLLFSSLLGLGFMRRRKTTG